MKNACFFKTAFLLLAVMAMGTVYAQPRDIMRGIGNRIPRGGSGSGGNDSLERRDRFEDSLTLTYHYLDSTRNYKLDSSISDYTTWFPVPAHYVYLGNVGTAAHSLLFASKQTNGWDAGFHALDIYKWKLENVRFYNTTRPYTQLGYLLGSQTQQNIEVLHTQNIKPYWNFSLGYRLINAPGFYKNQKVNHNNYLLSSWYQSPKKRYNNYFVLLGNSLQAGENGGILNDSFLKDPIYNTRFNIPTKLGGDVAFGRDFFNTALFTGNKYTEFNALMRQQYDFGRKDSIVTDSTVIPLFYPRLRFEHTFNFGSYKYGYKHITNPNVSGSSPDSAYYKDVYNFNVPVNDSILLTDRWREITNDFSIYQFPDAKNQQQFIKAGIAYQYLSGDFRSSSKSFYNIFAHGEYRNTTRNKKWDIEAFGNLYLNGYNAGDYKGYISLQRFLSQRLGSLQVGFENINRSPSFIYDARSSFHLDSFATDFKKENTTHFFGALYNDKLKLQLRGDYYLLSNYLYLTDFYKLKQENSLFNVLRVGALKTFNLGKYWRLHSEVWAQQKTGNVQVNFPSVYTRNRLAFEGNFFKNLYLATGIEAKYHTPYKGDNYSPVLGQFFYQDSVQINNLPTVDLYFNFRIRSFKAFIRTENLNSMDFSNGFGFTNNSVEVPDYPYPGMVIRVGIYWSFVN